MDETKSSEKSVTVNRILALLSIMIVVIAMGTCAFVALGPFIENSPAGPYHLQHSQTYGLVYSGIVGVIVGFYMGRLTR